MNTENKEAFEADEKSIDVGVNISEATQSLDKTEKGEATDKEISGDNFKEISKEISKEFPKEFSSEFPKKLRDDENLCGGMTAETYDDVTADGQADEVTADSFDESLESTESAESIENIENAESIENIENAENIESIENADNTEKPEGLEALEELEEDLPELVSAVPHLWQLGSIKEIGAYPRYAELRVLGLSVSEAYYAVNGAKEAERAAKNSENAQLDAGLSHLTAVAAAGNPPVRVMSELERKVIRATLGEDVGERELERLWRRVNS